MHFYFSRLDAMLYSEWFEESKISESVFLTMGANRKFGVVGWD